MVNDYFKLTPEGMETQAALLTTDDDAFKAAQVAIYTMIGGGMIGRHAVEQPESFYIDARVSRRPYPLKSIYQAVEVYKRAYKVRETEGRLPERALTDRLVNLGVF